jgi:diguanylate cyclase (GGDEF)-like protein
LNEVERHTPEGRVIELHEAQPPTLDDVETRRLHLWIVMIVLVVTVVACLFLIAVWGELPLAAPVMVLPVVVGYCAYGVQQEKRLREATRHLLSERVLVDALERRLGELTALLDAGRAMNDVLELSEVLERILDNALDLLAASNGSVMLLEPPDLLRAVCVRGNEGARNSVVHVGDGVAGRVAASREALLIHGELGGQAHRERTPDSAMSVPLMHRGDVVGVLNVNGEGGRIFDEYDLRALSVFGEHAASSIANARLYEAERSNAEALAHRAYHDPLTDLGNRDLFAEHVQRALTSRVRRGLAVIFFDLDDFKKVNDSLGHGAGDELLCTVAERLVSGLRGSDFAARFGGDEFAVLLHDVATPEDAVRAAERLLRVVTGPVEFEERIVTVRASMGVAMADAEATADLLLRNADVALYAAKGEGKNCVRLFEAAMHDALVQMLELEAELDLAVERSQLDLRYQPIVSLSTGRVTGFEALVRWNHPERGEIQPDDFIPLAEQTGQIVEIDRWVLLKACCQGRAWQVAYPTDERLSVAVNLSTRQLEEENVVEMVKLALEVSGLAPEDLVMEITESFLLRNERVGVERLEQLRSLGVRIAIDDFGTGYSSLSYLRHLPIDVLKIDRSFIDGLGRNPEDTALVQAILRLARSLNLETIAEGVERPEQRTALAELHCTLAQGWHFSKPLPSHEMEDLLRTRIDALPVIISL